MTDIIERLLNCGPDWTIKHAGHIIPYEACTDAAEEIKRLRDALKDCFDHVPAFIKERYRNLLD